MTYADSGSVTGACQICNDTLSIPIMKKEDFELVRCKRCKLVYVDNIDAVFNVSNYDYYKESVCLAPGELYDTITTTRYISLLKKVEACRKSNRLFDVGCGSGHFLYVAKQLHWQEEGIDIAPYAINICQKLNLNSRCSDFLALDIANNCYDIVMMSEVIEHLTRPRDYLLKASSILRRGGILIITTPNFNCITRMLLRNKWSCVHKEHLFYFTVDTIRKILNATGFDIMELKIKNITVAELLSIFRNNRNSIPRALCNQSLRGGIEGNKVLLCLKSFVNSALNISTLGESISCICRKR